LQRFEGKLGEIEKDIVEFLVNSPLFVGQSEYMPTIKSYFITRRDLTQKDMKDLTGYSTGVISQALRELVEIGFIEKANVSKMGKITYSMSSIVTSFLNFYLDGFKQYDAWKEELEEIMADLEKKKEKLKELRGFDVVYKYMNLFLGTFAIIQPIVDMIKNQKIELEHKELK
jgi:DNA-binding transcriptional regulator GbsR (MarR family)